MFFADPENDMECYEEHNESGRDGKNRQHILQEPVDKSTKPSNTKASNTDQSPYKRIIHKSTQSTSQQDVSTIYEYIYIYEVLAVFNYKRQYRLDSEPVLLLLRDM